MLQAAGAHFDRGLVCDAGYDAADNREDEVEQNASLEKPVGDRGAVTDRKSFSICGGPHNQSGVLILALLVFGIWSLVLFFSYRRRLHESERYARETWARTG